MKFAELGGVYRRLDLSLCVASRRAKLVSSAFAAVTMAWLVGSVPAQAASFPVFGHGLAEAASGTVAAAGNTTVSLGPIAEAALSCEILPGSDTNSVASLSLPGSLTSGTAYDHVVSMHTATSAAIQSTSTVQNVNLLGGLIRASAVGAVANTSATSASAESDATGSQFANLFVAGLPIAVNPAPNTTIPLPGIGSVVLNEQDLSGSATSSSITVVMIHVYVSQANAFVPIGSDIRIARAESGLEVLPDPATVSAEAYGLQVQGFAGNLNLKSGPTAEAEAYCTPHHSTVSVTNITSPVGNTGASVDTAATALSATSSAAQASSDIANVNLLGGLVTANAITSNTNIVLGSSVTRTGAATLANVTLAGKPVAANPAPNTKVSLAGLGYAVLNEQSGSTSATTVKETVVAIDIYVTTANVLNLPVGARIEVARSTSTIHPF